jgi:hypothetical protein
VTAVLLLAAAAMDLTRCSLVAATVRQAVEAAMPISAGLAAAAVSIWTARGCRRGGGCPSYRRPRRATGVLEKPVALSGPLCR